LLYLICYGKVCNIKKSKKKKKAWVFGSNEFSCRTKNNKKKKIKSKKKAFYLDSTKMFKRENRLLGKIRFNNSHNFFCPQFILKTKKNELLLNRFGIVISKKIDKRAVIRNKIKRMLRTILADLDKNMFPGHDILIITRQGILNKTKEENNLLIKNALEKAGIIK